MLKILILIFCISGCGVKGDPLPPLTPTELGRGQPTYKSATEDLIIPEIDKTEEKNEQEKKDDGE